MLYSIRHYSWFYGRFCIAKGALYSIQTSLYGVNYIQKCLYSKNRSFLYTKENIMWTTPSATEMRFGFEVTMYVMNK